MVQRDRWQPGEKAGKLVEKEDNEWVGEMHSVSIWEVSFAGPGQGGRWE